MARVNYDIFRISELKWTGMGELNSDVHYIYYCWQEPLRRNRAALIVTRVWNSVKVKLAQSCLTLCDPMDYTVDGILCQNTGVGSHSILQGIFSTQRLSPGFPHCRQILYKLSHKGNPRIVEWVAYPFSSGSSQPRNWTGSPALQVNSLPTELSGKPSKMQYLAAVSKSTEWSLFISKANNSISQ